MGPGRDRKYDPWYHRGGYKASRLVTVRSGGTSGGSICPKAQVSVCGPQVHRCTGHCPARPRRVRRPREEGSQGGTKKTAEVKIVTRFSKLHYK
jgi:hypothetical protein